jgi:hypothetical protein
MKLNESCGINSFLIKSCPTVVQALYFLSLKLKLTFKCMSDRDDLYIDFTRISEIIWFSLVIRRYAAKQCCFCCLGSLTQMDTKYKVP